MCRESACAHAGGPAAGGAVQGRHGAHRRAGRPQGSRATADAAGLGHPQRQGALPHCLLSICPAKAELPLQHAFTFALTAHCAAERQLLNHVTALLPVVVDLAATLSIPWESALRSGPDAMGWLLSRCYSSVRGGVQIQSAFSRALGRRYTSRHLLRPLRAVLREGHPLAISGAGTTSSLPEEMCLIQVCSALH